MGKIIDVSKLVSGAKYGTPRANSVTACGQNGGITNRDCFSPVAIWAFFILMARVAVTVSTQAKELIYPGNVLTFDDMDTAIDTITEMAVVDPASKDFELLVDSILIGIKNFTLEYPEKLSRRWNRHNAPLGASWTEYRTVQQGTWWAPWYPASCVHQNEFGDTPITITLTQAMTYGASWTRGFDIHHGVSASMSIGYETTESNTRSESQTYVVPAHSYGQVWQQQLMVWQDQQNRRCKKHHYQKGGIKCGDWSESLRGDLPVKNGVSFGWSTGKDKMDFNSCGGGS
ncbi:hypothetical protein JCM33374_g2467 [Metschnikowia sp. JCM 33374]|nr:hypothetical protein JCM33374_g2467 [Metschnikowia sp. JCM 33374]